MAVRYGRDTDVRAGENIPHDVNSGNIWPPGVSYKGKKRVGSRSLPNLIIVAYAQAGTILVTSKSLKSSTMCLGQSTQ